MILALFVLLLAAPTESAAAEKKARYEYDAGGGGDEEVKPTADAAPKKIEARAIDDDEAKRLLRKWDKEPSIRAVQEAAARYAQIDGARIDSWRITPNLGALAPELSAEYRRNVENDQTIGAQSSGNVDYTSLDDDDRYTFKAKWELDRLIFNPDELRVSAEVTSLAKLRENVVDQVTKLYFERRRLQVELDTAAPSELGTRLKKELRLQELTAALDGMTGGWFVRALEGKPLD